MFDLLSVLDARGTGRHPLQVESDCLDIALIFGPPSPSRPLGIARRGGLRNGFQGVLVDTVAWRYSLEPRVKRIVSDARR